MKKIIVAFALIVSFGASLPAAEAATTTLTGKFIWRGDKKHDVKVVLTPQAGTTDQWTAVYTFKWKSNRTWLGTMTGSLTTGKLVGTAVETTGRNRSFAFTGNMKDGTMADGTSAQTKKGKNTKSTGTIELAVK